MLTPEVEFPSPSVIKEAIQYHFKTPVIFKNSLKSWIHVPWTTDQLSAEYGNTCLHFRLVFKNENCISWEGSAKYVKATINQFLDWQCGKQSSSQDSNPFDKFSVKDFWAYSAYNYLSHIFPKESAIVKAVNWSAFGYPETSADEGAFWIGSEGSYTPCHFDTYGFNFVAQIQGRKRWVLFPPEDSTFMYPTRIPYEESSVFSSVNMLNPDFNLHPLFKFTHPHIVVLEPGEVLFVPNKWWHFVQSLDTTVSINTWIKSDFDNEMTHLEEGVARALMSSFISYFEPVGESWLNPNEEITSPEETLKYISLVLQKIKCAEPQQNVDEDPVAPSKKIVKKFPISDTHSNDSENKLKELFSHKNIKCVNPTPTSKSHEESAACSSEGPSQTVNMKNIIDCFVHPKVVSVICELLKNNT